jgi:glycosyltransferase involved in cell wall biosynthesis
MNTRKHYVAQKDIPSLFLQQTQMRMIDVDAYPTRVGALYNFLFSNIPYTASRFMDANFERELISLLKEKEFDIIQLEGVYLSPYIPVIRRYSDAKISIRAHNIEYEIWKRIADNSYNPLMRIYHRSLSNRVKEFELKYFPMADVILAITQRDAAHIQRLGIDTPVHIIPAGIDLDKIDMRKHSSDFPNLFHLGALDWAPNLEGLKWFLKNVWAEVLTEIPDIQLHIAGRNASAKTEKCLKGQANVIYHGEVEDAYRFMREHAIMIVPLLSGGGMRIKILEGMALSKTIISTAVGAEGMDYTEGKNILIANTKQEFVSQIVSIAKDKENCLRISRNANLLILEKYDNFALIKDLLTFYENMI